MAKQFPIDFRGNLWKGGTNEAIQTAAEKTRRYTQVLLRRNSPKRTGTLSKGWEVSLTKNGYRIRNPVPYTGFVIKGTRRMRGNPFFQKTVSDSAQYFKEQLATELGKKFAARITTGISNKFDFASLNPDVGASLKRSE
jgi:hypothetical protein